MKSLIVLCTGLLCLAGSAAAGNVKSCNNGDVRNTQLAWTGTVNGNVDVPLGAVCTMQWAEVSGWVTVEGTLIAISTKFDTNVTVSGAGSLQVINNFLGQGIFGNLLVSGSGNSGLYCPNQTGGNYVKGNVMVSNLTGIGAQFYTCEANIDGWVQLLNNDIWGYYGNPWMIQLTGATIKGYLDCAENAQVPNISGTTASSKRGQCLGH
jgi:hypothetical protein